MTDKREESAATGNPVVSFIKDATAEIDEFDSHTRVANALATVICNNPELEVVGLLGPWGSGKSTVIEFAGRQLEAERPSERVLCFKYDAWLHQSDPPRRSFLEALLRFLILKQLTTKGRWETELAKLNRQIEDTETKTTPTLSASGRFLLPAILLVPFGMQLLDKGWFDGFLVLGKPWFEHWAFLIGLGLVTAPLIVAATIWLCWRPWEKLGKSGFWRHRAPYENESILSIFMNKERTTDKSTTIRTPDPTTIEFQNLFREVLQQVNVDSSGKPLRFVFVIDNLDRLPESAAVEMWATVRSFFLGSHAGFRLPTVILPIDEKAVERMYGIDHPEDAEQLAKSFMDKTFDLAFRVTPPVLSDWQKYIATQLSKMFGKAAQAEWPYIVGSIYRDWHAAQAGRQPITPREINTTLNRIGTLYMQWSMEGVTFASIAAYAIHRREIDDDIFIAVRTPKWGAEKHDDAWALSIAAMHYGVPLKHAAQILLNERIRDAIGSKSADKLADLSNVPGFDMVFHSIVANTSSTIPFARTIVHLSVLKGAEAHWRIASWEALRGRQLQRTVGDKFSSEDASAYNILVDSVPETERGVYFAGLARHYAAIPTTAYASTDATKAITSALSHFMKAAQREGYTFSINIKAPAPRYLLALQELADDLKVAKAVGCEETDVAVLDVLAGSFSSKSPEFSRARAVFGLQAQDRKLDWAPVIEASAAQLRDTLGVGAADAAYALGCLRKDAAARKVIDDLLDNGHLAARFHEALGAKGNLSSRIAALILTTKSPSLLTPPGDQKWAAVLAANPELPERVAESLAELGVNSLGDYADLVDDEDCPEELLQQAASSYFQAGKLRLPSAGDLGRDHPRYYQAITSDDDLPLLEHGAASDEFWISAKDADFEKLAHAIPILLGKDSSFQERTQSLLREKLNGVTEDAWTAAIAKNTFPMGLAKLASRSDKAPITGSLPGALTQTISALRTSDLATRNRWFALASKVSKAARRTLLKSIADAIIAPDYPRPRELLSAEDGLLAREGELHRHGDNIVRNLLLPMLSTNGDLSWLNERANSLAKTIAGSDRDTREALHEQLTNAAKRDADARASAESLQATWGLEPLKLEPDRVADPEPEPLETKDEVP